MAEKHKTTTTPNGWTCTCGKSASGIRADLVRSRARRHELHPDWSVA